MNVLTSEEHRAANIHAIFNLYMYASSLNPPSEGETFESAVRKLPGYEPEWERIFKNAVLKFPELKQTAITNYTYNPDSLTACCFESESEISVVFKGTGDGEWLDNGDGLSGIPALNTYETYLENGEIADFVTKEDYASFSQVESLNWFNKTAASSGWDKEKLITVSGHSKGGNKAQFIALNSSLPDRCISFNAQGFSPEAVIMLEQRAGGAFKSRCRKIFSFCSRNDYVNVIGKSVVPEENMFFFESWGSIHFIDSVITPGGYLRSQCERGRIAEYMMEISDEIMELEPSFREYATVGAMNIFQKYVGKGTPVNSGKVSEEKIIGAMAVTVGLVLKNAKKFGKLFR